MPITKIPRKINTGFFRNQVQRIFLIHSLNMLSHTGSADLGLCGLLFLWLLLTFLDNALFLLGLTSQKHSALISFDSKRKFSELWRFSALIQRTWKTSALNSTVSALIFPETALISAVFMFSETALISADVFHVLWISAEKRQISEKAMFSADYLWDYNLGFFRIISCYK